MSSRAFIRSGVAVRIQVPDPEGGDREPSSFVVPHSPNWYLAAVACLSLLVATSIAVALYAFHQVSELSQELESTMARVDKEIQRLEASTRFDSRRQHLLLGIRDEIMKTNPTIPLDEAYRYAQLIVKASVKYPSVHPLMLLAIGIVESGYERSATSHANAKGLYQIWPSTGRLLARSLKWEYSEEMLYDPEKNTELAAFYLDILFSAYNDEKMVLAEYNGGPVNAGYLRAGSDLAAAETRDYVVKVSDVFDRLKSKFDRSMEARLEVAHRDTAAITNLVSLSPESPAGP